MAESTNTVGLLTSVFADTHMQKCHCLFADGSLKSHRISQFISAKGGDMVWVAFPHLLFWSGCQMFSSKVIY